MDCVLDCSVDEQSVPETNPRDLRVKVGTTPPPAPPAPRVEADGVVWHWVSDNVSSLYSGAGVY